MEKLRSISSRERTMKPESFTINNGGCPPTNMRHLRSYTNTTSYASLSSCFSSTGWSLSDAELIRKSRIAAYKVYGVEAKMKGSLRKSFRWIKHTCSQLVYRRW